MRTVSIRMLVLAIALAACGDSTAPETGTVEGVVVAPDGVTAIVGAVVRLEGRTTGPTTETNAAGAFTLEKVPAGNQTLEAVRGNFSATIPVNVVANSKTQAPIATIQPTGELVYVRGSYDSIENILVDQLKLQAREIPSSQLATVQYPAVQSIFLNCGMTSSLSDAALANLRSFIQAGGLVYASDLTMDIMENLFPEDFISSGSGSSGELTAEVVDTGLRAWLQQRTQITLRYNLGGWATLEQISNRPRVLLRRASGTPAAQPLAVVLQPAGAKGQLVYTTFHNSAVITPDQLAVLTSFVLQ
jgi:hypothetical protein